jgi:hypothetical protein
MSEWRIEKTENDEAHYLLVGGSNGDRVDGLTRQQAHDMRRALDRLVSDVRRETQREVSRAFGL